MTGWISKVTKQGQLRLVNLPDMASAQVNGKTRMFHIIMFIVSRQIAKHGNLWRFSTAKLEARGAN